MDEADFVGDVVELPVELPGAPFVELPGEPPVELPVELLPLLPGNLVGEFEGARVMLTAG